MGKAKIKKNLDKYCNDNNLPIYSESKIGRIIKDKKIYHHRQKISHFGKIKEIKRSKKQRKPGDLSIKSPRDLVEIDVVVRLVNGLRRYIVTAVDVHSRYALAMCYNRHNSISAKRFFQKLEIIFPGKIKSVQTDNGSEFHKYFMEYLKEKSIIHYFNYSGQPCKQGHIERFNRSIQEEFIDWHESYFDNLDDFNNLLVDWLLWYNTERPHWNLNLMSPMDYSISNNFFPKTMWTNTIH
jgi:transposase InsO family protein